MNPAMRRCSPAMSIDVNPAILCWSPTPTRTMTSFSDPGRAYVIIRRSPPEDDDWDLFRVAENGHCSVDLEASKH